MNLKKFLKNKEKAQSVLEYTLLVAIAILGLLVVNFIFRINSSNSAFERHFQAASYYIGGVSP